MVKVWFITGAGRGFGKAFARAALGRGDRVAATARDIKALDDLLAEFGDAVLPLAVDVRDRAAVFGAVERAATTFGRLDVVVNNAGYGLFGAIEEITEQQLRDQLEVNLFGVFHVTQAVLPLLRAQGAGHIIQISTVGGVAAFPRLGGYHASKWAVEGLTESLAQEVAQFGVKVTLVEPGPYETDWAGSSAVHAGPQPQYQDMRPRPVPPELIGDPAAAGPAILKIADADTPPLRVFFGTLPTLIIPPLYADRLATWEEWKPLAVEANGR